MSPALRKLALTAHVTVSLGWFGAIAAFFALSITGLTSPNAQMVQAACLAMDLTTWYVIVPLALASLVSGIISSVGTRWGLFQYYWVVVKLLITILSTMILMVHTQQISLLARAAARMSPFDANLKGSQLQMAVASGGSMLVLLLLTILSVYKPRGLTRYGQRKKSSDRTG